MVVFFGLGELRNLSSEQVSAGLAISVFFAGYGAALVFCAWQLSRARPWARGPVLLAQLILHPQSVDALNDEQAERS